MYNSHLNLEKKAKRGGVTRVVSITSGKGGVGKTHTTVNCAIALAQMGRSVAILDADLNLANINVVLGLKPRADLQDVMEGRLKLVDIMLEGPEGIVIIPSASGAKFSCNLDVEHRMLLTEQIEEAARDFDYLLVDTQAGIGSEVMYFNSAASEIVCVINAEPTSLTDAYALIKVLAREYGEREISIVANNVANENIGYAAFSRLENAVARFLRVKLRYLGSVPSDNSVNVAITEQQPVLELFPSSVSSLAFVKVAEKLDEDFFTRRVKGGVQFFFRQLMDASAYGC